MENWLWILILIFFVFRLLLKAGKNIGSAPSPRGGQEGDRTPPVPEGREEIWERMEEEEEPPRTDFRNPLLKALEEMAGPPPRPIIPPQPRPVRIVRKIKTKEAEITPPKEDFPLPDLNDLLPLPEESGPDEKRLIFSSHPILQGIIISEVLGPPLAFRDGTIFPGFPI